MLLINASSITNFLTFFGDFTNKNEGFHSYANRQDIGGCGLVSPDVASMRYEILRLKYNYGVLMQEEIWRRQNGDRRKAFFF